MKSPLLLLACCLLALVTHTLAWGLPPIVNPATYHSPSGKFALEVDPSDLNGRGPSQCRLTSAGQEVWAKKLPFTFSEALVTDDGLVAGYAYSQGLRGWGEKFAPDGRAGDLHLAVLDPDGDFLINDHLPRMQSLIVDANIARPTVEHILLHPAAARFTALLSDDEHSWWQSYDLSKRKKLKAFEPKPEGPASANVHGTISARAVSGLPLSVVQWYCFDDHTQQAGSLFTLVDLDGHQLWQLSRPDDQTVPGDKEAEEDLRREVSAHGSFLDSPDPGTFALWSPKEKKRTLFSVIADGDKWQVQELRQEPYSPPPETTGVLPKIPERPLRLLGDFVLGDPPAANPMRGVSVWAFDGANHLGLLRQIDVPLSFALLDTAGKFLAEIPLAPVPPGRSLLAWSSGSQWLLANTANPAKSKPFVWWLDVEKKTQTALHDFDCPPIRSLAATRDGGFIVLATQDSDFSSTTSLIAFDHNGRRRWAHAANNGDQPADLFSPEAVAVTTRGEVAVLDVIRHTVQLFDLQGKFLRVINLEKSWGRTPEYPSEIYADSEGGFFVEDAPTKPPFVWMKADGTVREQFQPKFADGRAVGSYPSVQFAPDDSGWIYDGEAFYPLNKDRVAQAAVGVAPDSKTLQALAGVATDSLGHLYAADKRTGVVHVFDQQGRKIRLCRPAREDLDGTPYPGLVVAPDGTLYVSGLTARGSVQFNPDGERVGLRPPFHLDIYSSESWVPAASGAGFLVVGEENCFLTDDHGAVVRRLERCADRTWLAHPTRAVMAPHGTFAVLSPRTDEASQALTFFSPQGDPVKTVVLPGGDWHLSSLTDRFALLFNEDTYFLCTPEGEWLQRFEFLIPSGHTYTANVTLAGQQLWVTDLDTRHVFRYALPEK